MTYPLKGAKDIYAPDDSGLRYNLYSPTKLPLASSFLWSSKVLLQVSAGGFVRSKYLSPEPAKYSYAPNIEATTFFQPEMPYYAHHPGRFFYIKDLDTGALYSAPYEPVKARPEKFVFSSGQTDIRWDVTFEGLKFEITLTPAEEDIVELWSVKLTNASGRQRRIKFVPCFSVGFMSWMNQSAAYDADLQGIVADCVTPYQKLEDYDRIKACRDKTFLLARTAPDHWEVSRARFEGRGGIHKPESLETGFSNRPANYETPIAALSYDLDLGIADTKDFDFLFGPAFDKKEISRIKQAYFGKAENKSPQKTRDNKLQACRDVLQIETPDKDFNNFVNSWLPRQLLMHGEINRLTQDPQTRNYLQDNMGMSYLAPEKMKQAILRTLSQQNDDGSLPDGILLHPDAKFNYINTIPHNDHNIWLPICLESYLDETNDYKILDKVVAGQSVTDRINAAMTWLIGNRDNRGLSYIAQGDWCDPMNMVGPEGKGVSGWLTIATAHALKIWSQILTRAGRKSPGNIKTAFLDIAAASQDHLWDGQWFIRGISDNNQKFGQNSDSEGRIFLNPQSWALMSGIVSPEQSDEIIASVEQHLATPYGATMLAPAYTKMHEHIGRVTQKFPGSAENGSVYNHAAVFYIYSLYQTEHFDLAFKHLRAMLPQDDQADILRRGQLPIFLPNYYRGAYHQFPDEAGRSSHMFNTGTVSWYYRCVIEELIGLRGHPDGLLIRPKLPSTWPALSAKRLFRGSEINLTVTRGADPQVSVNGKQQKTPLLTDIKPGQSYDVKVII